MSLVEIRSYLRVGDGQFVPMEEAEVFDGDCRWVPGAIVFTIDGVEVLSFELWDDINWLWPFIVQALDDCRREGRGERYFPDQPLLFRAEMLGSSGQMRLSVTGGGVETMAVGPAEEIYEAVAHAALCFFPALYRLCPSEWLADSREIAIVNSWIGTSRT